MKWTTQPRFSLKGLAFAWLSIVGVITVLSALLSSFGKLAGLQDYCLFDWMALSSNTAGYIIAVGVGTACILLPRGLPWWCMAIAGAVTGAIAGVLAGAYNFLFAGALGLTTLNVFFLASAGALPGLVIPTIYSAWLAPRRLSVFHYVGAAMVAGTLITLVAFGVLVLTGVFKWSFALVHLVPQQLWPAPTLFAIMVLAALSVADSILEHHISF